MTKKAEKLKDQEIESVAGGLIVSSTLLKPVTLSFTGGESAPSTEEVTCSVYEEAPLAEADSMGSEEVSLDANAQIIEIDPNQNP